MSLIKAAFDAAENGDSGALEKLIREGVSPDAVDDDDSLLSVAAIRGHLDCVRLLLDRGANPNGPKNDGGPGYFASHRRSNVAVIREILTCGGRIDIRREGDCSQTILMHCAADELDTSNLIELLKHKPDLEARNDDDESALSYAAA